MEKLFVPYRIALLLKGKGFDELFTLFVNSTYFINERFTYANEGYLELLTDIDEVVLAPTYHQVFDWIFKKLEINYPYLRIEMYSDGSGEWIHPGDEENDQLNLGFDNLDEAVENILRFL